MSFRSYGRSHADLPPDTDFGTGLPKFATEKTVVLRNATTVPLRLRQGRQRVRAVGVSLHLFLITLDCTTLPSVGLVHLLQTGLAPSALVVFVWREKEGVRRRDRHR